MPPIVSGATTQSRAASLRQAIEAVRARDIAALKDLLQDIGDDQLNSLFEMLLNAQSAKSTQRLESAWSALGEELAQLALEGDRVQQGAALDATPEEWIADAMFVAERTRVQREQLSPLEAVKATFLHELEAEPRAWTECRKAHASSIAATCKATSLDEKAVTYDLAIIDEAAQVGMDVLIPMARAAKVVLVGDHRQLPPYVESEIFRSGGTGRDGMIPSLFESLWSRLPQAAKEVLPMQFRMNRAIGEVVSRAFYEPEVVLRHHGDERKARLGLFDGCPVVWIDTGSPIPSELGIVEEKAFEMSSLERELTARILRKLAANAPLSPLEIGIACMYSRQRDAVDELLSSTQFETLRRSIRCDTTDSFQGQEFEHVLVLCSRRGTGPGFLREPSRLNVAMSRARRQVVIFADRSLAKDAPASLGRVQEAMQHHKSSCRFLTISEAICAIG
jgi:hypothetical protein